MNHKQTVTLSMKRKETAKFMGACALIILPGFHLLQAMWGLALVFLAVLAIAFFYAPNFLLYRARIERFSAFVVTVNGLAALGGFLYFLFPVWQGYLGCAWAAWSGVLGYKVGKRLEALMANIDWYT